MLCWLDWHRAATDLDLLLLLHLLLLLLLFCYSLSNERVLPLLLEHQKRHWLSEGEKINQYIWSLSTYQQQQQCQFSAALCDDFSSSLVVHSGSVMLCLLFKSSNKAFSLFPPTFSSSKTRLLLSRWRKVNQVCIGRDRLCVNSPLLNYVVCVRVLKFKIIKLN